MFCALAVLAALLIARPFAEAGICDDWSYVYTARHVAETGHLVYVGWAAAMLGWQVYVAAALFHLFGFSFTVARLTTWGAAMGSAFLLQRILARSGLNERNASLTALCFALSPVFFMLSSSFMTDVEGVFAILVCLYCCARALLAANARTAAAWVVTAVVSNALLGTCRQVAWLGVLLLVPSTIALLRGQRRVVLSGVIALAGAVVFLLAAMRWFQAQPYTLTNDVAAGVELSSRAALLMHVFRQVFASAMELPLFLLPLTAIFLPQLFRRRRSTKVAITVSALLYAALAFHWRHSHPEYLLEPTSGNWLGTYGYIEAQGPRAHGPLLLSLPWRGLLTVAALGGLLGAAFLCAERGRWRPSERPAAALSWIQVLVLLVPYTAVYAALLVPRGVTQLFDRYLMELLLLPLVVLPRLYQERVSTRLPSACVALLLLMAAYSVCCVHNTFAQMRAEIVVDTQLSAHGLREDEVDFGWAYDGWLEVQRFGHVNYPALRYPPGEAFVPIPPTVEPTCYMPPVPFRYLQPRYGVSYEPNLCSGKTDVAPVSYTTWPTGKTATLYVVRYTPLHTP